MPMSRCRDQRGLTLLEVLVAMVVISASLLLLLGMGMTALHGNHWANKTTVATQMMQQRLEHIQSTGDFSNGTASAEGVDVSWTCTPIGNYLRRVDISANWVDAGTRSRTNSLTAYITSDSL